MQTYTDNVVDRAGNTLAGAKVTVYLSDGTTLATLPANPITTGTDGEFSFTLANGKYVVSVSHPLIATKTQTVYLFDPTDSTLPTADEKAGIAGLSAADPAVPSSEIVHKVATLTALSAIDGSADQVVYMAGRTTAGDGGEGHFRWVIGDQSANVAADTESGVWVAGTDGTGAGGAWKRQNIKFITPSMFGASPLEANNTAAIQAAVNHGGLVLFDALYPATGSISLSSSAASPKNLVLLGKDQSTGIAFTGGGSLTLSKSNYSSSYSVRDMLFTSDGNASTKVVFSVAKGDVKGCLFDGFSLALEVNQAYQLIEHNTFVDCTTGIKNIDRAVVPGSYYNANAINNNFFAQCGTGISLQHTSVVGGTGSQLINPVTLYQNTFENCATAGIRLSWVNNVTISENYFEFTPINIYADLFSKNILVENIHTHDGETSIKLDDSSASMSGGRIKNLDLSNSSTLTQIGPNDGALGTVTLDATSRFYRYRYDGDYTPTITGSAVSGTTTYSAQFGSYVRNGNLVYVTFNVSYTETTGSGDLRISLPFPIATKTGLRATGSVQVNQYNASAAAGSLTLYGSSGNQFLNIYLSEDDVPWQVQQLTNETATFIGSITYITTAN